MSFAKASQDWGGRRKLNPDNAPRVSRQDILGFAQQHAIVVRREGLGMWFRLDGSTWYTIGQTNYLAMECLRRLTRAEPDAPSAPADAPSSAALCI